MDLQEFLLLVLILLLTYMIVSWYRDPLRCIPGPTSLPVVGNVLSVQPEVMHLQFYEMAKEYGPVFKVSIFNTPLVVLNSTEVSLEALLKSGTDFLGRPPTPRQSRLFPKDVAFSSYDESHHLPLRRLFTRAIKAYGPGVSHLENIMQETILDIIDDMQAKEDGIIDLEELCNGYVCCVLASLIFGEKYSFTDPVCKTMCKMNEDILLAVDPVNAGAILDMYPFLFNLDFVLPATKKHLKETSISSNNYFQGKIDEARQHYSEGEIHGCLDYLLEAQKKDLDENGKPLLTDEEMRGLLMNFITGGMETSFRSLCQAFLDLLSRPEIVEKLQAEIDAQFEPKHRIAWKDRDRLPLLQSFIYENLRCLSLAPLLVPHYTIRDTQVAGYKLPAKTWVIVNNYYISHDPAIYEDPFTFKLDRFLDETGSLVSADHPMRHNLLSFGRGKRQCPGELLAKTRIFLFLANILQKFDIEPVGELPVNDVRQYKLRLVVMPPTAKVRFTRRQQ